MKRKVILTAFTFLALVSLFWWISLDLYFSQNGAREPKPEEGRIYPEVTNKVRVYLTGRERIVSRLPIYSFFISLVALLYFGARWKFMRAPVRKSESGVPLIAKKKRDAG